MPELAELRPPYEARACNAMRFGDRRGERKVSSQGHAALDMPHADFDEALAFLGESEAAQAAGIE